MEVKCTFSLKEKIKIAISLILVNSFNTYNIAYKQKGQHLYSAAPSVYIKIYAFISLSSSQRIPFSSNN
ncbi:hypothetical protein CLV51_101255 [Chitinophaga niastensis]|uniref:Uncharacterized protein n=1 Tax=Chitinophaga niastensis TaxID=536980 RepID=A0A2P8HRU9_CHINA|nr:hypothetical protein CLV51_101255 [Chitinophaga niastensis]